MAYSKKTVVAIGKFDGVHKGHQALLEAALSIAEENKLQSVALVINSPRGQYLISPEERYEIIKELGIDLVETQNLTPDFMNMSASEFVLEFLIKKLNCSHVVVGYNFRFAKGRKADADCLKDICSQNKIACTIIPKVSCSTFWGEVTASSTNIRGFLYNGDVALASEILGRPYSLTGEVVSGKQIGRTINSPTANTNCFSNQIIPKEGVYATRAIFDNKIFSSITNIGSNPTVNNSGEITVETHIIDFSDSIYGKEIKIEFVKRIRDEKKFANLDELKKQIQKDIECAKNGHNSF